MTATTIVYNSCTGKVEARLWQMAQTILAMQRPETLDAAAQEQAESEQAFLTLVRQHGGIISRVCFSYARDTDDFNDLRQDVLLNIWRGLAGFRGASCPQTWIYRIAFNTCISTVRQHGRRGIIVPLEGQPDKGEPMPAEDERIDRLHEAIARLGTQDRAIIVMWLDECSYEDIAEVMGMGRNTVATRLRRIKGRLAQLMTRSSTSIHP